MGSVYTSARFVFIAMVTAEFIYAKSVSALSPATEVTFVEWKSSDPAIQVIGWRSASVPGKGKWPRVRFWLYQKPDGKIATVFDACEICGAGWVLQKRQRGRLQELCGAHQSAIGGNCRRMQSSAAKS